MPNLGLGTALSSSGLITPGVVTSNLVMKHMYPAGAVQPLSDGAVFLDGNGDYITIGEHSAHAPDNITDMSWIKVAGTPAESYSRILDRDDVTNDASRGYHIRYDKDALKWAGVVGNGSAKDVLISSAYSSHPTEWTHVALTYDGTVGYLYVDGVRVDTSTGVTGNLNDSEVPLYIGRAQATSNDWDGYICNVGIWSRALTQSELKSVMFKGYADLSTSEKTSIVSWWALDEGTGITATDSHGSTNGSATFA